MNKSTIVQIVTVSGKYEIWESLLTYLESSLLQKAEFYDFTTSSMHDMGRDVFKALNQKFSLGGCPQTLFLSLVKATRDSNLIATRADKLSFLRF